MRRTAGALLVMMAAAFHQAPGQKDDEAKKSYFSNMSINPDGHVCYSESIGKNPFNRIEYTTDGKGVLEIFFSSETEEVNIQATDLDNNGTVDLIFVMKQKKGESNGTISKIEFYRGPAYAEHLKRHLGHALLTAIHPLIKDRPEEIKRAEEIRGSIGGLSKRSIPNDEQGLYIHEYQFSSSNAEIIREAFSVSDSLSNAIRNVISGDFRMLSKYPQIAARYSGEINTLLGIDPLAAAAGKK